VYNSEVRRSHLLSVEYPILSSPVVHSVHIYEDSHALISRLCAIVSISLRTGDSVLVVATAEHREELLKELRGCGLNVTRHAREGRYTMLDASQTLATFMRDGMPDAERFSAVVGPLLGQASASARGKEKRLTVFGEMVAVLWEAGNKEGALQLEGLWNNALASRAFHLHCAYPHPHMFTDQELEAVRSAHSHLVQ